MAVSTGNFSIAGAAVGGVPAKALALGAAVVWQQAAPSPVTGDWLCFTSEEANSTVHLDKVGSPDAISLETSTDGSTWTDYSWTDSTGTTLTLANVGDKVYFRAKTENQTIGSSDSNYYKFVMSGQIAASGNIQTLLKADGSRTDAPAYCYRGMFLNCTALTAAPELPATTLAQNCYKSMFIRTSLTSAPELPATKLAQNCYNGMFSNCSSLNSIEVSFTDWQPLNATQYWVNNVAGSGTFTCPAALPDVRSVSYIPTGWTRVDVA